MSVHYYFTDGLWLSMKDCKVRVNGTWKQCNTIYTFRGGSWKTIWPITTVYLSSAALQLSLTDVPSGGTEFYNVLANANPVVTIKPSSESGTSDWVIPEDSTLVLYLLDYYGNLATTDGSYCGAIFTRESDTTMKFAGCPGISVEGGKILHGSYSWVVGTKDVVANFGVKGLPVTTGFEWVTINTYQLKNISAVSSEILAKPIYPYFASTGTQHTTGISLADESVLQDLVIRQYSVNASDGEEVNYRRFTLTQTGNGSGTVTLYVHNGVIDVWSDHNWTTDAYAADTAVLTDGYGESLWWDGTQKVDSVTLSIN